MFIPLLFNQWVILYCNCVPHKVFLKIKIFSFNVKNVYFVPTVVCLLATSLLWWSEPPSVPHLKKCMLNFYFQLWNNNFRKVKSKISTCSVVYRTRTHWILYHWCTYNHCHGCNLNIYDYFLLNKLCVILFNL